MTDDRRPPKGPPPPPLPPPPAPLPTRAGPVSQPRRSRGGPQFLRLVLAVLALFAAGFVSWALNSPGRSGDPKNSGDGQLVMRPKKTPEAGEPADGGRLNTPRAEGAEATPPREPPAQPDNAGKPLPPADQPSEERGPEPSKKTTPPKPQAPAGTDLESKTKPTAPEAPAKTLYQEVVVWRRPTFLVSGITISQDLKYRVLSKLYIRDGKYGAKEVKQEIYETELEKADGLSKAVFAESLEKMQGESFTYTVDVKGEIVEFAGPKERRKNVKVDDVGGLTGQGFLMSSVMDEDGWKELAQLSFLLPEKPVKTLRKGQRWQRKITHDWGSLGSWYGKTTYRHAGDKDGEHRVEYVHQLTYVAPGKGKPQKPSPLKINSAAFKPIQTNGEIYFNAAASRVSGAREWFHVQGAVSTSVLGQTTQVQVEEKQYFAIRVMDKLD